MRKDRPCMDCGTVCWRASTRCFPCHVLALRRRAGSDIAPRFWVKVDMSAGFFGCWPWQSTINGNGYGQFWVTGRYRPAHQVAWELSRGREFPAALKACHSCDRPLCVNPSHIFEGTALDNSADCVAKGRTWHPVGELHPMAKLTSEQVAEIRAMAAEGRPHREIAPLFGISDSNVSRIVTHASWAA